MARDIYVLLYTLCGGLESESDLNGNGMPDPSEDKNGNGVFDSWDHTTTPGTTLYTLPQLKEMAQFAVNLVDELDQDNVVTIFEYDTDLSDGWDLDDQAWTVESALPPSGYRGVVAGVEGQQLTFSETLWVRQEQLVNDNPYTPFDDTTAPAGTAGMGAPAYHFVQIELRNASPKSVDLAEDNVTTTVATGSWRLRWVNDASIGNVGDVSTTNTLSTPENGIVFLDPPASGTKLSIGAGQLYSIATSNYPAPGSADLFVNYDTSPEFELVAPRFGTNQVNMTAGATGLSPNTDLDLINVASTLYTDRYKLINGVLGDFISADYSPTISNPILVLERRANPKQPQIPVTQNPWVVVDWTRLIQRDLVASSVGSGSAPTQADTQSGLQNTTSQERPQPLAGESETKYLRPADPEPFRQNSIKGTVNGTIEGRNVTGPTTYSLLQPHFDRDFASPVELFLVPLRSPKELTRTIQLGDQQPSNQYGASTTPYTAAAKFLLPIHPSGTAQLHNHWHRLLALVEVPTKMHQQLGDEFATTRVPGKININTLRHPQVLAALLDSPLVHGDVSPVNGHLPTIDLTNLWGDFLISRDGELAPEYTGSGMTLPGYPGSNPFRDLGHTDDVGAGDNPIEDTILRSYPPTGTTSGGTGTDGGLFDVNTSGSGNNILRRQLLTKLMNNTTTRSNVFFVFIHVQFHEAYEDPTTGAVRIGGQIDLNGDNRRDDGHRGFFIVDRSDAEQAYDPKTGKFDWKQIVKHRLTIH
ncbi:hypothetical protein GC176_08625 [bacterium]|nr:hypothetical protein [bacterium]